MKYNSKAVIALVTWGTLLTSCRHSIDQTVIQSFTGENKALEEKLPAMKSFKERVLIERAKKYSEMIATMDPAKRAVYEKENILKPEMNRVKEELDITAKEYELNYISFMMSLESNNAFVGSIPDSEESEAAIKADWRWNITSCNELTGRNNDLQKKMTNLLQQYIKLTEQVIEKYCKTGTVKSKQEKKIKEMKIV